MKSFWFDRYKRDVEAISPHFKFIRLKLGFWRVYWKDHYVTECYEEMAPVGYTIESYDPRLESQSYFEELEDHWELVRKIKNFVEGYYDSMLKVRRCYYQLRHDNEFFERSQNAYKQQSIR